MVLDALKNAALAAATDTEFMSAFAGNEFGLQLQIRDHPGLETVTVVPARQDGELIVRASTEIWQRVVESVPDVGFHSFTALCRQDVDVQVLGAPLQTAQALHALERLFELLRGQVSMDQGARYPDTRSIVGRYAPVRLPDGKTTSIYWEQSGNPDNPVLVMLHTAGADARQFHPLMADKELCENWSLVAFDLPAHGRSMPLHDSLWQGYVLSKADYMAICHSFIEQVLRRPVVLMGCSMGAAMALKLARDHPDLVLAAIALEAPFRAKGRRSAWLVHPAVNQAAHNPSYVRGLMSPVSPLFWRRVATWIYSQGGFGIYAGDLSFYSDEFDAEKDLKGLEGTSRVISLLTGSYDYSATPADSARVAAMIPGSRFVEMPDLGHFPMIENPPRLLPYLQNELNYIRLKLDQHE